MQHLRRRTGIALAAAGALVATLFGQTPTAGEDQPGLRIVRDSWGVPHVYADTSRDLFRGYGYAIAEDRLFQIEAAKRSFTGTVAAAFGPGYADFDAEVRANRDPDSLERQYAALSKKDRDVFEGYAAGVNERIAEVLDGRDRLLPKQFTSFGFDPEPWTGLDVVMIFVGSMANRYSDSTPELANLANRDALVARYGAHKGLELFDQVVWNFDPKSPTTVQAEDVRPGGRTPQARGENTAALAPVPAAAVDTVQHESLFSNLWSVGADRTRDGRSVLLNGPQHGDFSPAFVYSVGLHGAGFDLVGNAGFGYPAVYFGRNADIGWGATAGGNDTVDIYQEQLHPDDPHRYRYRGRWETMQRRTETVEVKGGPPRTVDVYSTVHGRVLAFDEDRGTAYTKKRSWEGREVETLLAWIDLTRATSWSEWRQAASRMAISVNFYYNDRHGNIGYANTGRYPVRPAHQDQRLPALGDGSMEWIGFQPFADNFQVFNPRQGYVANWNNKQAPQATGTWGDIDRVSVITDLLNARQRFTAEEIWDLNRTVALTVVGAKEFQPFLEEGAAQAEPDSLVAQAARLVADWNRLGEDEDRDGRYDAPGYSVFVTWLGVMTEIALADDLPRSLVAAPVTNRVGPSTAVLYHALRGTEAGVPQTHDLLDGEATADLAHRALQVTVDRLTAQYGADPATWLTPARPHVFSTRNFVGVPQALPEEEMRLPVGMNRGTQNHLVTFSATGASSGCEVTPPGQSGFLAPDGTTTEHYDDQLALYRDWDCKPTLLSAEEVAADAESTTVLD